MKASKPLSLLVAGLLVASLFAGAAAAVESTPEELSDESEVDSEFEADFELTELFSEFEEWTLRGETNVTDVTWTVTQFDQADSQVRQASHDGQTFEEDIDIDDGTNRVEVRITGTTPEVENWSYDPPETFTAANFTLTRAGGTERAIDSYAAHHYTEESKEARNALDSARDAVEASGDSDAESTFEDAVAFYNAGEFESATNTAERAEDQATQAATMRSALLVGAAAVVVLLLLGGGYYLYKSRQQGPARLR